MGEHQIPPKQNPVLPLARYRLRFEVTDGADSLDWLRGRYLGSAWRGAFGKALRNTVCITRQPVCDGCALLNSCPYPQVFEKRPPAAAKKLTRYPRTPGPYVLAPAIPNYDFAGQASLQLGLTLFGSANRQLHNVVHALDQAGQRGLTSRKIRLQLKDVQFAKEPPAGTFRNKETPESDSGEKLSLESAPANGWTEIYRPGMELSTPSPWSPGIPEVPDSVRVRLLSPLRLRRDNRILGAETIDFSAFTSSLIRRISMLTYFFSTTPLEADFAGLARLARKSEMGVRDLKWRELKRFSQRQRRKISMGGLVGEFELETGKLKPFWPFLWLGQWTHVGRTCSMGLGRYVIEHKDSKLDGALAHLRPAQSK